MTTWAAILSAMLAASFGQGDGEGGTETVLSIDANQVVHRISPYLYGACIEDVNHEIYGGLYSQLIFGESFQEPSPQPPIEGFTALGGRWLVKDGEVEVGPADGPKLMADAPGFAVGEASVDLLFPTGGGGNAGLIVKVDRPEPGADAFTGYEVSLEPSGHLVLGRHRRNWELLKTVDCPVPIDCWVTLAARMTETTLEILVDGKPVLSYEDTAHPLRSGQVGLRCWQHAARYRNLRIKTDGSERLMSFIAKPSSTLEEGVSGMWRPVSRGTARGSAALVTREPFVGATSQRLTFSDGEGSLGIENRGLNRWGLHFEAGKPYEGYLWARADAPVALTIALESGDGGRVHAKTQLKVTGKDWTRHEFTLTPAEVERNGRFTIALTQPGTVDLGHAFLQPGDWGRFKGLPIRKDVAEAMLDGGLAILRYGGSMINHPEYRWKKMIGPRGRRQPMAGWWYPYATNGWGIFDFLNFTEAAGIPGIPTVNVNETVQDMADFIEYVNGPADSPWGRKRAEDGHPEPYRLTYLELGNEEAVNDAYWEKFRVLAETIWAKDPSIILVVGDFVYGRVIVDPYHFEGGASVNSLAAHRKILELAKSRNREVWFDIHVNTDHPPEPNGMKPERSYIEQLGKIAPGANYKVVIFEYNSGNHAMRRALSNALATNEAERIGDLLPVACSANGLQPDGQNDNGWDQGLLFLNPAKTWLQPPGYLIKMIRGHHQPLLVQSELQGSDEKLSINVKRDENGKAIVVQAVNWGNEPRPVRLAIDGFSPARSSATVEELAGPLDARNTADEPNRITPRRFEWEHGLANGRPAYTFPPRSITILSFE